MGKAYKFEKQQINGKWYTVCTSHEHMPMIEHCKDGRYKVTGCDGKTVSDETRQKMSNAKKGISFSESHKNSLKEACKKKNYSEIFNEDVRKKLSDAKKGKAPNNSKAVFASNGLEFESMAACERFFKIDRRKIEKAIEKQISINGIFFSRNRENA